jgi:hypothetical protein
LETTAKNKSKSYRQLIRNVADTSGYLVYEVEDVLDHLIGNIQLLLAQGIDVKLSGLGTIRVSPMTVNNTLHGKKVCYTTHRLSLATDEPMRRYLQENYVGRANPDELAVSNGEQPEDT